MMTYRAQSSCDASLQCRQHQQPRDALYTRKAPHPQTGHAYVFLTYPSDDVSFIDVDAPAYCKCVN